MRGRSDAKLRVQLTSALPRGAVVLNTKRVVGCIAPLGRRTRCSHARQRQHLSLSRLSTRRSSLTNLCLCSTLNSSPRLPLAPWAQNGAVVRVGSRLADALLAARAPPPQ